MNQGKQTNRYQTGKNPIYKETDHGNQKPGRTKGKGHKCRNILSSILAIVIVLVYGWLELTSVTEEVPAGDRMKAELVRVVDGDTIIVNLENEKTRVRLIGINAPESVHLDASKNTQEGRDASAFLKEYLAQTEHVWLEFDEERQDQYDRTLAYVWMSADGTDVAEDMLNGIIVKNGFAEARSYKPNVKYQEALEQAER